MVSFSVALFPMVFVVFPDRTTYILNLLVQSIGYYIQNIVQLGWHTDAFEQLGKSSQASYRRFIPPGFESSDGPEDWIDAWTLFYWGWWISWSPFVGKDFEKDDSEFQC